MIIKKKVMSLLLIFIMLFGTSIAFGNVIIEEEKEPLLREVIADLLDYYDTYGQYTFRQAAGLYWASDDPEYSKRIHTRFITKDNSSSTNCASNIIGLIAAGYDPQNYNDMNFVEVLVNSQNSEGQFLIDSYGDYPTSTAYSILALDMANASYDQDHAVRALLDYQNEDGSFGAFPDVDTTAMSLMSLGAHKEKPGVSDAINTGFAYIKSKQLDTGGFSPGYHDWNTGLEETEENPYTICTVLQALVANGIDPFHDEWTKNDHNMVEALLAYRTEKYFQYNSEVEMLTEQVLCALSDAFKGLSMYQGISLNVIDMEEEFQLRRIGTDHLTKGAEGKVTVEIQNNTATLNEATLIIGLYDLDTNNLVYYNYLTKEYPSKGSEQITNVFLVPATGNYGVKIFLWDNINDMNIKATPISIDIE